MKEYTLDNFKMASIMDECEGAWSHSFYTNGRFEINYSSILTKLIQTAGRICKYYASDLFIDWNAIERELTNAEYEGGKFLFGFRESGVDGNAFVLSRLNNYGVKQMESDIVELYMVEIEVDRENWHTDYMTMRFGKAILEEN